MRRRDFIKVVAGAAAWPLAARAQQGGRMRRVGIMMSTEAAKPIYRSERERSAIPKMRE